MFEVLTKSGRVDNVDKKRKAKLINVPSPCVSYTTEIMRLDDESRQTSTRGRIQGGYTMAFSDFAQVQREFRITYQEQHFLNADERQPSQNFLEEFVFNQEYLDVYTSEASRAEMVICPILREVYKQYYQQYIFWVQKSISYDKQLTGTPDYIIAKRSTLGKTVLEFPVVLVTEAKRNDFEQGWGQCLAELVAAQKLNKTPLVPVYGIVTDGKLWEFGKLREEHFVKNKEGYTVDHLASLFGVLNLVFHAATQGDDLG